MHIRFLKELQSQLQFFCKVKIGLRTTGKNAIEKNVLERKVAKNPNRLSKEIIITLIFKLTLLFILWKLFFSAPSSLKKTNEQTKIETVGKHIIGT